MVSGNQPVKGICQCFFPNFLRWGVLLSILTCSSPPLALAEPWWIDYSGTDRNSMVYRDANIQASIQALTIGHYRYGPNTEYVAVEIKFLNEMAMQAITKQFPPSLQYENRLDKLSISIGRPPSQRMRAGFFKFLERFRRWTTPIPETIYDSMKIFLEYSFDQASYLNWIEKVNAEQLLLGIQVSTTFAHEQPVKFSHENRNRDLPETGWRAVDPGTKMDNTTCPFCTEEYEDGTGADLVGDFGFAHHAVQMKCGQYCCYACFLTSYRMIPRCPFCRSCMPGIPPPSDNVSNGQRSRAGR